MRKLHFSKIPHYIDHGSWNKNWYSVTERNIKRLFPNEDYKLIADLLAITSMNSTLQTNVTQFLKAFYQYKNGLPFEGYLPNIVMHLEYHRQGKPFGGRKVANFAKALKGDKSAIVVDLWMLRAFGIRDENVTPSKSEYDYIEWFIFKECLKYNMTPRQMQAAIWVGIRQLESNSNGPTNYYEVLKSKMKPCLFTSKRNYTQKYIYT